MTRMDVLGLDASNPSIQFKAPCVHPYASSGSSSVSSSASSSSSSVFSLDAASTQSSVSSTSTNPVDVIWENENDSFGGRHSLSHYGSQGSLRGCISKPAPDAAVAPELRKHPRRTNSYVNQSNGAPGARPPPCLMRQSERKVNFVDNLVDTASQIVEIIWPLSAMSLRSDSATGCKGVLPLRTFIQETLRRSRTSYSTLQVALYYLIKIKPHVPNPDLTKEQSREKPVCRAMQCGRRMFLAALILASKYLQDRNYSARAWSKISGLNTLEINQNELMFLEAVGWRLHISEATFQRWTDIVLKYTPGAGGLAFADGSNCWRAVIPRLTPELDTVVDPLEPATPSPPAMARNLDSGPMAESPSPRNGSTAQEPTSLPSIHEQIPALRRNMLMTLEPTRMEYPNHPSLPSMPRPPMLPTPQMTPQSSSTSTPAASANNAFSGSRRPSISAAVSQAQNMGMARSTLDQRPPNMPFGPTTRTGSGSFDGFPSAVRRSSLARSSSSTSSPESMVSDVPTLSSSRSSRSSSVSSSTSGPCAPSSRLAVKATLRCTNNSMRENRKHLPIASPIDEGSALEGVYSSPEGYAGPVGQVPDFSHFSLGTPVDMAKSTQEAAQSLCELSGAVPARPEQPSSAGAEPRRCRKRGRTGSDDQLLQNQVRHLINLNASGDGAVLSDGNSARSFVIPESSHSQMQSASQLNLPKVDASLSGPAGMKRACCGHEARKIALNPTMRAEYLG